MDQEQPFNFTRLQETLEGWPEAFTPFEGLGNGSTAVLSRIYQVLRSAFDQNSQPNFPDLAPLLRQVLYQRQSTGSSDELRVISGSGWPTRSEWEDAGFCCLINSVGYVVSPRPWNPSWLSEAKNDTGDIFSDCFGMMDVRHDSTVPIDPFFKEVSGVDFYANEGQREAIRSLLFMPEGSTLIVNLPTGSGKTLVAQAPVLLNGLHGGLTLFVVPTTALAIDQARRMEDLLARNTPRSQLPPFAWYGTLDDFQRETIKSNIRTGKQGILFASPEAVVGALLPSLYKANELGLLKYLVIDEAHLIVQWGDGFRPSFQALAGARRGLLRECTGEAFRTVLMSATFSPQIVETLDVLFSPVQMVSSIHLRPEPRYLAYRARDEDEKNSLVIEVLRHVPRPYILYVTTRDDAKEWYQRVKSIVLSRRVELFTGETPQHDRERIIGLWAENKLDGIVATSAFGVGIDKNDVRTIIHATVPESLDRFYQEVGRGGRDGKASLSITIYTSRDAKIADRMSSDVALGIENKYERWETMYRSSKRLSNEDLVLIDLSIPPARLHQQSEFNSDHNMRTLIAMARAELIQLDSLPPQNLNRTSREDTPDELPMTDESWSEYFKHVAVKILDPQHPKKEHFYRALQLENKGGKEAAEHSLTSLQEALRGKKEMGDALGALYESRIPGRMVVVSKTCRGCPAHPMPEGTIPDYQDPVGVGIERLKTFDLSQWVKDFPYNPTDTVIFYPASTREIDDSIYATLSALIANFGVREIAAHRDILSQDKMKKLHHASPDNILVFRSFEDDPAAASGLPLPRVTLLLPWGQKPIPDPIRYQDRPFHIIIAPDDIQGDYPHKRLIDIDIDALTMDAFLRKATT